MEGNRMKTDGAQPLELLVANDAVAICEKLESDFRNNGDFCHNNIGSKTGDDWERMDKFLVDAANEIRSVRDCVKNLVALYSRQKLRNCDVGTGDEQAERFRAFCNKEKLPQFSESAYCAHECSCRSSADCKFAWAQMPYEAEEGAVK